MFAKKNVVAAAALTLVAAAAQAQVTVYGTLDVSLGRKEAVTGYDVTTGKATTASTTNVDSSDMSQSFIGFKGQEDLGGGLKAVFKLESELGVDTGAAAGGSSFWNRNATVGVAGGFGALNLGRAENLFKLEGQAFNPFGESQTFSPTFRGTGLAALDSWSNSITYVSPNLGGLTLSGQAALGESAKSTAATYAGGAYAISANFVAGPLALSGVYGEIRSTDASIPGDRDRVFLLGASYDLGAVKFFGQYGQHDFDEKAPVFEGKLKGFQVGASIPVAADGAVLVSYGEGKETDDVPANPGSFKAREFSLGYTHNLSKRTNVYAAYNNERLKDAFVTPNAKATLDNFAVGVRHSF